MLGRPPPDGKRSFPDAFPIETIPGNAGGSVAVPGGATAAPIVVDGTLYVVTGKGQLIAFR